MSAIKGYQSKNKPKNFEYATVENLGGNQYGLTTSSTVFYENIVADAAEAGSTDLQIVATAHVARVGDVIRVTSGVDDGYLRRVDSVDANNIYIIDPFPSAVGIGDTFDILRPTIPTVDQLGGAVISGAYPEDSASTDGDNGLFVLAVRNDTNAALTSTDGDYSGISVDASGNPQVDILTEPATVANGGALPADVKVMAGYDGANVQVVHTDATGDVQVDIASALPAGNNNIGDVDVVSLPGALTGYAEDSAHTSGDIGLLSLAVRNDAGVSLAGTDGDYAPLSTDSSGNLRVSGTVSATQGTSPWVENLTEVGGAAISLGQAAMAASLPVVIASDQTDIPENITQVGGAAISLGQKTSANSFPVVLSSDQSAIDTNVLTSPGTYAEDSAHVSGDIGMQALAVRNDAGGALAGTDGDYIPLTTDSNGNLRTAISGGVSLGGKTVVTTVRNDYTSTAVTTGAWVQLVASLGAAVTELEIFDSSGETLELGTGAAAAETRLILLMPGGNGRVPVSIASGTRLSIRAVSANASVGELDINIYGV